jgi:hypothetical protein
MRRAYRFHQIDHRACNPTKETSKKENTMSINSKLILAASTALMLSFAAAPSFAKTQAQCEALFAKADTDGDGTLAQMEDPKWQERIDHMTGITKKDITIIQKDQFMTSCMRGEMDGM